MTKKTKQVRCKRCGSALDSQDYAEHLVKYHMDFSLMRKNGKVSIL